jgi:hypothetical protein
MNEHESRVCARILEAIVRRPMSRFFWDHVPDVTNPGVLHPFSLSWICARLEDGKYTSPMDVMHDIRVCLQNGKSSSPPGSIRAAAAHHLLIELDSLASSFHPTCFSVILPIPLALAEFAAKNAIPAHGPMTVKTSGKTPVSEIFHQRTNANNIAALTRDIKFLCTGILPAKVAVLVKRLQPEAVSIGDDLSFSIGVMTEGTRVALREYLDQLLADAAAGKIDPFQRAFGDRLELVRIQERGMCWNAGEGKPAAEQSGED